MVAITILTGGLIFVSRIYNTAKHAIQRSFVMFRSGLLLESKMFEFEEKGMIKEDFKDGKDFTDEKDYSWLIRATPVPKDPVLAQKLNINLVTLEVARHKDKEEKRSYITKYYLTTFLFGPTK
jgi:hypothetical protein